MSFEFGQKGYTFGMIALICCAVSIICSFISALAFIGWIAGVGTLVFAIMAYVTGKKELAADPSNSKAKTGKTIGLVVIIVEIVVIVLSFVFIGCTLCAIGSLANV